MPAERRLSESAGKGGALTGNTPSKAPKQEVFALFNPGSYMYPYHEERTRCGECHSTIQISFRCPFAPKDDEAGQPEQSAKGKKFSPLVIQSAENGLPIRDFSPQKVESRIEQEPELLENEKTGFVKYMEIGE